MILNAIKKRKNIIKTIIKNHKDNIKNQGPKNQKT